MDLLSKLNYNSEGKKYNTRKQIVESMEALSKEGDNNMEIRESEISPEDLQYLVSQGLYVKLIKGDDYNYYKIIWRIEYTNDILLLDTTSPSFNALLSIGNSFLNAFL